MMLEQPIRIGGLTAQNRLVMPPMQTNKTQQGHVTDEMVAYYREHAVGSKPGVIIVEHCYVDASGRPDKSTVYFYYKRESSSTHTVPQPSGGIWDFPTDTVPLTLTDYSRTYIRPRCGPGSDYKTFASKSDNGTQLYQISSISRIRAHFVSGNWVYVTFNNNSRRSGGFYQKSQFSPDIPWTQIVSYDMDGGAWGTVTSNVTPHNGPGSEYGDYPSCGLRAGESVRVYMESNGWYFCNFYNDRSNKYGWVWLWVPAGYVRLN